MPMFQVYRRSTKEMVARVDNGDFAEAAKKADAFREVHGDDYYVMRVEAVYTTHSALDDFKAPRSMTPEEVQRAADHQRKQTE